MIKNPEKYRLFERQLIQKEKPDFCKNLAIVNELHKEALSLGIFGNHPLDGIETDLRIAAIINHVRRSY